MPFVMQGFIAPNRVRHYEAFSQALHLYSLTNFFPKKNVGHLLQIHELLCSHHYFEEGKEYLDNLSIQIWAMMYHD